jgi:zinc protease
MRWAQGLTNELEDGEDRIASLTRARQAAQEQANQASLRGFEGRAISYREEVARIDEQIAAEERRAEAQARVDRFRTTVANAANAADKRRAEGALAAAEAEARAAEIATEREVILEERNQRVENNPAALFREQKSAMQYLNHRYGIPIIGWRHEMETLDRDDALAFYERFYAPNNAILIVAGDVAPDTVRALAEEHYGPIPANPDLPDRVRPSEPPQIAERRLIYRDARVAQPYVSRSYLAPERDSGAQETAAALSILADVLGSGTTSVMAEALQFDTQIATFTGAFYGGTSLDQTTFDLVVVPSEGVSLEEAEAAMDRVLADFLQTGVDAEQLDRVKTRMRAAQIYARDSVESIANRYGRALTQGLTVEDVQAWPEILQAVSADDVLAAAQMVLDRRQSVTGWLMSEEVTQ